MFLSAAMICLPAGAAAKKDDKKAKPQKSKPQPAILQEQPEPLLNSPVLPLPDPQAVEFTVSQMLAAWQIGDVDLLHTFYADEALVVSGTWEPPLQGWQSYAAAYLAQRARTQGARLERTNTFTKISGDIAVCTYQWEFNGQVDGAPSRAYGHTTLVLQKRGGKWLIILNHTSAAPLPPQPPSSSALPAGATQAAAVPGR